MCSTWFKLMWIYVFSGFFNFLELMGQTGQVPYSKSIKVKVICKENEFAYKYDKGESRVLINCAVADSSKAVKCTVYDSTQFPRFKAGPSLILRNIIKKKYHKHHCFPSCRSWGAWAFWFNWWWCVNIEQLQNIITITNKCWSVQWCLGISSSWVIRKTGYC